MKNKLKNDSKLIRNFLRFIAWRDFLLWAMMDTEVLLQFERSTGTKMLRPVIVGVITDSVSELPIAYHEFIVWATKELWGEDYAPAQYFDILLSYEKKIRDKKWYRTT